MYGKTEPWLPYINEISYTNFFGKSEALSWIAFTMDQIL